MRNLFAVLLTTLVSLFAMVAPATAMDWRQSDRAVVAKDEVISDDVSLTGAHVIVDGTITVISLPLPTASSSTVPSTGT